MTWRRLAVVLLGIASVARRDPAADAGGTVLGVFADAACEGATLHLGPGAALVICRDGVSEAANGGA